MLMFVAMCLTGAMMFAKLFPETPTGRRLHQLFVDVPADWLSGRGPRRLLWTVVLGAVLALAMSHGVPLALPLDSIVATFETSTVLDIAAALAALSASAMLLGGRAAWSTGRNLLTRGLAFVRLSRPRARSRRRPARQAAARSSPPDDGESDPQWAFAIA